jgi:uncharacterized membrane protein
MARETSAMPLENPKSTWQIGGHPTHPALVGFPIAFLYAALVTDLLYWRGGGSFWAEASFYLIAAGVAMGLLAAAAGFTDFVGDRRIRALRHAWQHMLGNVTAMLLAAFNLLLRWRDAADGIVPTGLVVSAAVALLLAFTGWRGGDLVFRHRVGVADQAD